jgi:hypothetical protein
MEEHIFAFFSLMLSSSIESEELFGDEQDEAKKDPILFYTVKYSEDLN